MTWLAVDLYILNAVFSLLYIILIMYLEQCRINMMGRFLLIFKKSIRIYCVHFNESEHTNRVAVIIYFDMTLNQFSMFIIKRSDVPCICVYMYMYLRAYVNSIYWKRCARQKRNTVDIRLYLVRFFLPIEWTEFSLKSNIYIDSVFVWIRRNLKIKNQH